MKMDYIMCYDLKFSREINPNKDYISPGGYEIISNGRTYSFDFEKYYAKVDEKDRTVLHVWHKKMDIESFPEAKKLTPKILSKTEEISEFFIYLGENDTDLQPIAVNNLHFKVLDDLTKEIHVSEDICKNIEL